jgi:hypothetical protein
MLHILTERNVKDTSCDNGSEVRTWIKKIKNINKEGHEHGENNLRKESKSMNITCAIHPLTTYSIALG